MPLISCFLAFGYTPCVPLSQRVLRNVLAKALFPQSTPATTKLLCAVVMGTQTRETIQALTLSYLAALPVNWMYVVSDFRLQTDMKMQGIVKLRLVVYSRKYICDPSN